MSGGMGCGDGSQLMEVEGYGSGQQPASGSGRRGYSGGGRYLGPVAGGASRTSGQQDPDGLCSSMQQSPLASH